MPEWKIAGLLLLFTTLAVITGATLGLFLSDYLSAPPSNPFDLAQPVVWVVLLFFVVSLAAAIAILSGWAPWRDKAERQAAASPFWDSFTRGRK